MGNLILRMHLRDERALHALLRRRREPIDLLMRGVTHIGDAIVVVPLALALALGAMPVLDLAGRRAFVALVASHLLVQLVKRLASRPRPVLPPGISSLIGAPDRFSFPSGHAAAALSVALPLGAALPAGWAGVLLGLALLVGASRCYLGVHYPGDVLGGWILAAGGFLLGRLPLPGMG